MLKKSLESVLTSEESDELISAFDQVGNIIIVRIPDSLLPKKKIIGETLLNEVKIVRSVFYQSSAVEGDFRTRNLEILAGEDNTETEYKEFNCKFIVDVEKAFFSPRLSTERERIAKLTQDGEVVVNMFAGVGMFSIMAAKKKKCTVYSLDLNPVASKLCERNILINKLAGEIISINGDASKIIQEQLIDKIIICMLADGHMLLEGVPGLAKTLTVKTLAASIDTNFQRIQFTPDLLPADILGTKIYKSNTGTFEIQKGPIFHNFVLADEINRAPPKVQSALLAVSYTHLTLPTILLV